MDELFPIPPFFDPHKVGQVWRVPYQERAAQAEAYAQQYQIQPAATDQLRTCLLAIDVQNTFCLPEFELFVGGRSGLGAVNDNLRLCEFIYRNLGQITQIVLTLDTHTATQIFHPVFWLNAAGEHPAPTTMISLQDVQDGVWRPNPAIAATLVKTLGTPDPKALNSHALHYVQQLTQAGKYPLTVWPYHSMLGGIGHAVVAAVEEAVFFHGLARSTQALFEIKGNNPLTENYSVLRPEVMVGAEGAAIAHKNASLIRSLLDFDRIIIAGQAKSHCVAWTIDDLLAEMVALDPSLTHKVYLLEDCTSPVVVPGVIDFTEAADAAYQRFAEAGMHRVVSTMPLAEWPV
jgi:nicotinamidase-related amidase